MTPSGSLGYERCQTGNASPPACSSARGRRGLCFPYLPTEGSGAPRGARPRLQGATHPRVRGVTRTLRSVRSPLGAPLWRFFGRAPLFSTDLSCCQPPADFSVPSSRPGPSAWRAGPLEPPRACVADAAAGGHTRLHLQDRSGRRPSLSQAKNRTTLNVKPIAGSLKAANCKPAIEPPNRLVLRPTSLTARTMFAPSGG